MKVMVNQKIMGQLNWFRVEAGVVTIQVTSGENLETGETFDICTISSVQTVEVLNGRKKAFVEEEYF